MKRVRPIQCLLFASLLLVTGRLAWAQPVEDDQDPLVASYRSFMRARIAEMSGNFRAAEAYYQAAIRAARDPSWIYADLGHLYKRAGQWEKALNSYRSALRGDPSRFDLYRDMGEVLEFQAMMEDKPDALSAAIRAYRKYLAHTAKPEPRVIQRVLYLMQRAGDNAEALELAESYAKRWPDLPIIWQMLVRLYRAAKRPEDVRRAYQQWLKLRPEAREAWQAYARFLVEHGEREEALEALRAAWLLKPDDLQVLRTLVRSYREMRAFDSALELVHTYREKHASDPDALQLEAEIRADRDGPSAALAWLDQEIGARDLDPMRMALDRIWLLYRARRYRELLELAQTALAHLQPDHAQPGLQRALYEMLGRVHYERQEYDAAIAAFEKAQALQNRTQTKVALIQALIDSGRFEKAAQLLKPELENEPDEVRWVRLKADLLARQNRLQEALDLLDRVKGPARCQEKAALLYQQKRYPAALDRIEKCLTEDSGNPELLFLRGATLERLGRYNEAARAFQNLLQKKPDHAAAMNYLGYMWIDRNTNLEEALHLVQKALELDPENPAYIDSLAWGYYRLGQYEEARHWIEEALRRIDFDPLILDHAGDIYAALNRAQRALAYWHQALETQARGQENPDFQPEVVRTKIQAFCRSHPELPCPMAVTARQPRDARRR